MKGSVVMSSWRMELLILSLVIVGMHVHVDALFHLQEDDPKFLALVSFTISKST